MSFRLFIYYCALCGGAGAFVGWALGRAAVGVGADVLGQGVKGLFLGIGVTLALGVLDAWWSLSLRRLPQLLLRVLVAVGIGCLGGMLGGMLGEALYGWQHWLLVVGWMLLGFLIGVSLGVFDLLVSLARGQEPQAALRKIRNGVVGGTLGGLIGGILSILLGLFWGGLFESKARDQLWSPSAFGFVALGACIGLLIALAQVILKEAWLSVESGFRPGRELILSKPEISIGRAESCDVGLFGDANVERVHAIIRQQGGAYILLDTDTAAGTYVNDERVHEPRRLHSGDEIRLGRNVLRFGERRKEK